MPAPEPTSRTAILDAAEDRFAVQGFTGTTIKQIAAHAEVNSALLYYYFADKEALYAAMITRFIDRIATEMAQAFVPGEGPTALLRGFIGRQGRMLEKQRNFRKILGRELIDHDARHAQSAIRHLAATTFDRLRATIAEGQRAGIFRKDLDPRFAAISLVGQTVYFHFARPAVEILLSDGKALPAGISEAFSDHVAEFTLAALAPSLAPSSARKPSRSATPSAPSTAAPTASAGRTPARAPRRRKARQ